jgi:hypothetical protein
LQLLPLKKKKKLLAFFFFSLIETKRESREQEQRLGAREGEGDSSEADVGFDGTVV